MPIDIPGTPTEYKTIGHLFGVARSSVCEVVHEVCAAIVQQLLKVYIKFPEGEELDPVVLGFKRKIAIRQCVGTIDGSHIPICGPAGNHTDFYNRKGWYSVVQGLVDANYRFLDINIGWSGSIHDARILPTLHCMTKFVMRIYCQTQLHGVGIPLYIIGDAAYPLQSWLMKPFPHNGALSMEEQFA